MLRWAFSMDVMTVTSVDIKIYNDKYATSVIFKDVCVKIFFVKWYLNFGWLGHHFLPLLASTKFPMPPSQLPHSQSLQLPLLLLYTTFAISHYLHHCYHHCCHHHHHDTSIPMTTSLQPLQPSTLPLIAPFQPPPSSSPLPLTITIFSTVPSFHHHHYKPDQENG